MEILKVTDKAFQTYGKVIQGIDVSDLLEALKETPQCGEDRLQPLWRNACPGWLLQWK